MYRGFSVFVALVAVLTGCGGGGGAVADSSASSTTKPAPDVPELRGADPTLSALVDCGEDGVANVRVVYGEIDNKYLVGRNPTTQAAGGQSSFSSHYSLGRGDEDVMFNIVTSPTRGSCKTTLTDYDSGDVIAKKETSGKATLKVLLTGKE